MRFLKDVSQNVPVLLNLGPVLLNIGPVITPVPGNQPESLCQNSAKTVPNSDIPLNSMPSATAESRVTSKRPKNKPVSGTYLGP